MNSRARQQNTRVLAVAVALAASLFFFTPEPASAGISDNVSGWLWSGTLGWISLNCTNDDTCGVGVDYGTTLLDVPDKIGWANLFGWGWSETAGWVCFGETCNGLVDSGTTPEGGPSYAQYRDKDTIDGFLVEDNLYGWAHVISLGDEGWISLNCLNMDECAATNYRVTVDNYSGEFNKDPIAINDNFGWGGTEEVTGVGWTDFSGAVTTWTVARLGMIMRPEGIYEPPPPPEIEFVGTHVSDFVIRFNHIFIAERYLLECDIGLPDGSVRTLSYEIPETIRDGFELPLLGYSIQPDDLIIRDRLWYIEVCRVGAYLTTEACTTDDDCTFGRFCDEDRGFCRLEIRNRRKRYPIYTHQTDWSGIEADIDDQFRALRCHLGYPNRYFTNSAVCDFESDASFSLVKRRGIPVEFYCDDEVDNDGNGQTDCEDRYCRGISYRCQTLDRVVCLRGDDTDGIDDCSVRDCGPEEENSPACYEYGELCCSNQTAAPGELLAHRVVDGVDCQYNDPKDGYFDCDCKTAEDFDASELDDCYAPGAQVGELCCNDEYVVMRQEPEED